MCDSIVSLYIHLGTPQNKKSSHVFLLTRCTVYSGTLANLTKWLPSVCISNTTKAHGWVHVRAMWQCSCITLHCAKAAYYSNAQVFHASNPTDGNWDAVAAQTATFPSLTSVWVHCPECTFKQGQNCTTQKRMVLCHVSCAISQAL